MVTTSKTAIGSLDGLALDRLAAASADVLGRSARSLGRCGSGGEAVLRGWRSHRGRCGRHRTLRALGKEAGDNRRLGEVDLRRTMRSMEWEVVHLLGRAVKSLSDGDRLLRSDKARLECIVWAQAVGLLVPQLQAGNNKRGIRKIAQSG